MSGLAIGALVLGLPGATPNPPPAAKPAPAANRGLPGGSVFGGIPSINTPNVVDARLRLGGTGPAPAIGPDVDR